MPPSAAFTRLVHAETNQVQWCQFLFTTFNNYGFSAADLLSGQTFSINRQDLASVTGAANFLGLAGNMNSAERNRQSLMASVYVFAIMMVAYYAGQLVMDTFGISIPGLRIAGGLIVAFIGFRMLFPQQKAIDSPEVKSKSEELEDEPSANIAFVPLAMPSTAGPGTIAMIISSASTVRQSSTFADWVLMVAPPLIFFLVAVILWGSLRSSGAIMRLVGKGGIEAISRLMGFLLVCMGVQFIINGILEIIKTYH